MGTTCDERVPEASKVSWSTRSQDADVDKHNSVMSSTEKSVATSTDKSVATLCEGLEDLALTHQPSTVYFLATDDTCLQELINLEQTGCAEIEGVMDSGLQTVWRLRVFYRIFKISPANLGEKSPNGITNDLHEHSMIYHMVNVTRPLKCISGLE